VFLVFWVGVGGGGGGGGGGTADLYAHCTGWSNTGAGAGPGQSSSRRQVSSITRYHLFQWLHLIPPMTIPPRPPPNSRKSTSNTAHPRRGRPGVDHEETKTGNFTLVSPTLTYAGYKMVKPIPTGHIIQILANERATLPLSPSIHMVHTPHPTPPPLTSKTSSAMPPNPRLGKRHYAGGSNSCFVYQRYLFCGVSFGVVRRRLGERRRERSGNTYTWE